MQSIADQLQIALSHHQAGRLEEARRIYERILTRQPNQADALHLLGVLLDQQGQSEAGAEMILRAIAQDGTVAAFYNNLGNAYRNAGKLERAIAAFEKAIEIQPGYLGARFNLARLCNNLGNAHCDEQRFGEAIEVLRRAVELDPQYADAWNNLGAALRDAGKMDEAIEVYARAIALKDDFPEAYSNLAVALHDQGRLAESIAACRKAIEFRPDYSQAHANLGVSLCDSGIEQEAIAECERAVELDPTSGTAHSNLGLILLRLGKYERGWKEHEWRFGCNEKFKLRPFEQSRWDGAELNGKTILIHAEQGFGDTIQFVRYAPLVTRRGGRVIVECQAELAELVRTMPGVDRVIVQGEQLPGFDVHCPMLSLPLAFGTTLETVPAGVPYFFPDSRKVEYWAQKVKGLGTRVGLVWAGRPTHTNDQNRSMKLEQLHLLSGVDEVSFIRLQKRPLSSVEGAGDPALGGANDAVYRSLELNDWTAELAAFEDTAALIANLDLVIAVDTAVAHLAGALGKPTWVMIPFVPEWRWLTKRDDSPWYPTVRLFRQDKWRDWDGVVARVAEALREFTSRSRRAI